MAAALEVTRCAVGDELSLAIVHLPDRRVAGAPLERFVFLNQVERALYGGSSGAIYALLRRASLSTVVLSLKRSSIPSLVTEAEYAQLKRELELSLPIESQGRVKHCSLLALNNAVSAARVLGRGERSLAFLRGVGQPLPRLWEIELERAANNERLEVDLALEQEYDDELELETSLGAELVHMASFKADAEDDAKVEQSFTLSPVPPALVEAFSAYKDYRLEPLNRMRDGSMVVDLTASNDVSTCTRFLGWLKATHSDVAIGLESVMGHESVGEWVEAWVKMLREERGLKYSSLANYISGLFNLANYTYTALTPSEAAMALDVQPPEQLLRMRAQAEKLAAQDRLFARKDPNWIEWSQLQAGRIKCLAAWNAGQRKPHAERQKLLREVLVMLFFSVQPPDRVGIIRRLRFGMSVKANGDGFDLDLSNMRFKNSKFYGPTVTSISPLITPYLKQYLAMLEFETAYAEHPHLFAPARDNSRAMTSSQWSAYAKGIVKKYTDLFEKYVVSGQKGKFVMDATAPRTAWVTYNALHLAFKPFAPKIGLKGPGCLSKLMAEWYKDELADGRLVCVNKVRQGDRNGPKVFHFSFRLVTE